MISESALHSYADGELDGEMLLEVETWLHNNTNDLARVEEWRRHRYCLAAIYDGVLDDDVPKELLQRAKQFPTGKRSDPRLLFMAALLIFASGIVCGWILSQEVGGLDLLAYFKF